MSKFPPDDVLREVAAREAAEDAALKRALEDHFGLPHQDALAPAELCRECANLKRGKTTKSGALICEAFPQGIPADIQSGRFVHRVAHAGDHGIQFEAIETMEEAHEYDSADAVQGKLPGEDS